MRRKGVLLATGPLVALLSRDDARHDDAVRAFSDCQPPFRTCESVLAEACFLLRRVHRDAPAEVLAMGGRGVYEIGIRLDDHWIDVQRLLQKYSDRPISVADACLIRSAEVHDEPRILTFDSDFLVYRWGRGREFEMV